MTTIVMTPDDIKSLNKATFDAFLESGKYAFTYNQACEQFGRRQIDMMLNNGLLKNTNSLIGKRRFLISDIITASEILKKGLV